MRTFFQLVCILSLAACSAGTVNTNSVKNSNTSSKLPARPESGVFNVKHEGAEYQVSLETAESQAFDSISNQKTSFIVDLSDEKIVADRLIIFAEFYAKVRPEYANNGERTLLKGSNYTYQIDRKTLSNGQTSYQVNCKPTANAKNTAKANLNSKNLASFLQNGNLELSYLSL